ncbi:DUF1697 domain-containing protein [Sphingomonas jeddahensis]|uniref:DUF1697 domain-containing protein n=1 Tax=Sphingomonas jeddahensis TaxID=1915074 RepID=A0A1V2ETY7_9SPHN|nr:DUF1697 domain-containing protein [Sphingomonas jeddahensis]ONF96131.1 hypothetical protein SPHI_17460 [Sphingomonas jeddahensis]
MRWAALPRAINAGKPLAMADLRAFLAGEGMGEVQTLLASGNAVFSCDEEDAGAIEARLQAAARSRLALDTDWFVRSHAELVSVTAANPFPDATIERPNRVLVLFHHAPVDPARLPVGYGGPERLHAIGRELFVDYPDGIGRSKLEPALNRAKLPPSTARNWNTLLKLVEATRAA